jgi:hypothetical protein
MNGQIFWLVFLIGCGAAVCVMGRLLRLRSTDRSASLTQPDSGTARFSWSWDERLALIVVGACMGGFFFCGMLHTNLSPPNRPILPEPALGYTHLLTARHGTVYGTLFEYLAVTYGVWITWALGALIGLIFFNLKNKDKSRTYPRLPWQILAAAAISMSLYYAIWQLSLYVARS